MYLFLWNCQTQYTSNQNTAKSVSYLRPVYHVFEMKTFLRNNNFFKANSFEGNNFSVSMVSMCHHKQTMKGLHHVHMCSYTLSLLVNYHNSNMINK